MHNLLLHGALASQNQLRNLGSLLSSHHVYTMSFTGHGGIAIPDEGLSFDLFVNDIRTFLNEQGLDEVTCFGYSMGGYAALLASLSDKRIRKVITLGTKFDWTPETAAREVRMLNAEKMAEKIPQFTEHLRKEHHPTDWTELVNATAKMMLDLGEKPLLHSANLSTLDIPVHILVGEYDQTASVHASREFVSCIPGHVFGVLPETGHEWQKVNPENLLHEFTA